MKKIFILMLAMCLWLPLTAFSSVESGAIVYSSGEVKEVFTVQYDTQDAEKLNVSYENLQTAMYSVTLEVKTYIYDLLTEKINLDAGLTPETKQEYLNNIQVDCNAEPNENAVDGKLSVVVTYKKKAIWNYFCNDAISKAQETTDESFFVVKYTTKMPIKLSSFNVGTEQKNLLICAYNKTMLALTTQLQKDVSAILTPEYYYTYVVTNSRLHSDATVIEKDSSGYVYHTWKISVSEQNPTMTLWQTRANAIVWYALALGTTAVLGVVCLILTRKKGKTEIVK